MSSSTLFCRQLVYLEVSINTDCNLIEKMFILIIIFTHVTFTAVWLHLYRVELLVLICILFSLHGRNDIKLVSNELPREQRFHLKFLFFFLLQTPVYWQWGWKTVTKWTLHIAVDYDGLFKSASRLNVINSKLRWIKTKKWRRCFRSILDESILKTSPPQNFQTQIKQLYWVFISFHLALTSDLLPIYFTLDIWWFTDLFRHLPTYCFFSFSLILFPYCPFLHFTANQLLYTDPTKFLISSVSF